MELKPADSVSAELRDHLMDLYQRVLAHVLKVQLKTEQKGQKADQGWQATCDKLIEDQQTSKHEISRLDDLSVRLG